ncbi:GNAT family N-acetyltransferase [Bacillus infantis]|uniref:GNAT family N-acetyltransferase n=1 Tax=Bacillus infantis TaxID=324767 RepID=A0A5D4R931_9BACI|nr:GNAT family N-acetyltransferase [Bacillus infantis]TYS47049.1 GNAT family N-acetyltransferase [Bacillus infantis]
MVIRELESSDVKIQQSLILDLLIETYMLNLQLSKESCMVLCQEKLENLYKYINEGSAIMYGVFDSGKLIGFQWLFKRENFGEVRLHLNQIAVSRQYRGMGLGKQLLEKAKQKAVNLGIKTIDLHVSESNHGAVNLYKQAGFITERRLMKLEL